MSTVNRAKFTIEGTPSADPTTGDRGYDATNAQVLDVVLETPSSDVNQVTYQVFDPNDPESPQRSAGAPDLTWAGGTAKITPATPSTTAQITMPATGTHSYLIRATARVAGEADHVYERLVVIRDGVGRRKTIPGETTEYEARGWSDSINEIIDASGGLTAPTGGDNGKVALASGGNLSYYAGTATGRILTWNGTTWTSNVAVDLGSQSLTTTSSVSAGGWVSLNSSNNAFGTSFEFRKSRAGLVVQDGDVLGNAIWEAHDGSTFQQVAVIRASANGSPGAGDVPAALEFLLGNNTAALAIHARLSAADGFQCLKLAYGSALPIRSDEGAVQTTDATVTSVFEITNVASDGVYEVSAVVVAEESSDVATFTRRAAFRVVGGTVTQIGSTLDVCEFKSAGATAWAVTIDTDGTDIRVRVTGEAAHTIDWTASVVFAEKS